MTEPCQTFRIGDIKEDCIPSVLRDFSAPVKLVYPEQTPAEKAFLLTYDKDPVNKWHAAQSLATSIIIDRTHSLATAKQPPFDRLPEAYVAGLKGVLSHCCTDNGLKVSSCRRCRGAALSPVAPDTILSLGRSKPQLLRTSAHRRHNNRGQCAGFL